MKISISVPDILYEAAKEKAGSVTPSAVIRKALEAYVGKRAVRQLGYILVDPW